jgi:hypothetical protein
MKGLDFTFATMNNLLQHRDKLPFSDKSFGRSLCCNISGSSGNGSWIVRSDEATSFKI